MTRPTDAAIVCAFVLKALCYQELARLGGSVPSALEFIDEVTRDAEEFDAEAGGTDRQTEEVMKVAARECKAEFVPVASAAEPQAAAPYDRCPTCTAHMPVGQTCGGVNCGLKPA